MIVDDVPVDRLIPAHAGKTPACGSTASPTGAHPRSRGENSVGRVEWNEERGSSPLTRGKRLGGLGGVSGIGLIPAHAGKTSVRRVDRRVAGAHPRSRGENPTVEAAVSA